MVLQGKKVAFLGDSITEGVGASDKAHRYTDVFQAITGCTRPTRARKKSQTC